MRLELFLGTVVLVATVVNNAFGQSTKFMEGFIVTTAGDSVHGFIGNQTGPKNYDGCLFRVKPGEQPTLYKPEELRAYRFKDKNLMVSQTIELNGEKKPVFLEVLADGNAKLLKYSGIGTTFLFKR